jgi:hypothetical protein
MGLGGSACLETLDIQVETLCGLSSIALDDQIDRRSSASRWAAEPPPGVAGAVLPCANPATVLPLVLIPAGKSLPWTRNSRYREGVTITRCPRNRSKTNCGLNLDMITALSGGHSGRYGEGRA